VQEAAPIASPVVGEWPIVPLADDVAGGAVGEVQDDADVLAVNEDINITLL
jgi:hypothetical protein